MNDKQIKRQALHRLAEENIPADYDPWQKMQVRLQQIQPRRQPHPLSALRLAGLAVLLLLVAGYVFLMTPPGQAAAQNLLSLFFKAGSDLLPVSSPEPIPPTRTPVPTRMVNLEPAASLEPGAGFSTPTPYPTPQSGEVVYGLTLAEAEDLAGFSVREPADLPPGYYLAEVSYNPQIDAVVQIYKFKPYQSGEMLVLSQQLTPPADPVGQSAEVQQFLLGITRIEKVAGSWFAPAGADLQEWMADALVHTYRWQQQEIYFTCEFWVNETFSPAYLDETERQAVLELVIGTRAAFPDELDLNNLPSVAAAKAAAGFDVRAPQILPEDFAFSRAVFEPEANRVVLIYQPAEGSRLSGGSRLLLFEVPQASPSQSGPYEGFPPEAVESVAIGPYSGIFTRGAVVDGVYNPDFGITLTWHTGALQITMRLTYSPDYPARLEKEQFIAIAASAQ